MNILYLAKHYQNNNDDEGSIYDSLIKLGSNVDRFNITNFTNDYLILNSINIKKYDFILFHKLSYDYIDYLKQYRTVCWFFDAIGKGFSFNDDYAEYIKNNINLCLFTDGDFVNNNNNNNIRLLRQGLDSNYDYCTPSINNDSKIDILFIGTVGQDGYSEREAYITKLEKDYDNFICHDKYNIFKENLTFVINRTKIMLAMPPVTNNYWSNRVYLLCGRGAFLIHPYASSLEKEFNGNLPMYKSYDELKEKINYYINNENERNDIKKITQSIVLENHCYYHRCKQLIEIYNEFFK